MINLKTFHVSDKLCVSMGILAIVAYMLPFMILGEDAYINIWDALDGSVAHLHTIVCEGLIGEIDGTMPVMDGSVPSLLYVPFVPVCMQTWLYMYLSTYWAIVANAFFVKLIAFLGMYVLCSSYIIKEEKLFSFFVAIAFAFIPFYVDLVLSSAGLPLCFYAILNLEFNRLKVLSLLILAFFACNSSLNLIGFFVCWLWLFWIFYKWIALSKFPKWHACGLLIISLIYIVTCILLRPFYFRHISYLIGQRLLVWKQ